MEKRTINEVFERARKIREQLREQGYETDILYDEKYFEQFVLESCEIVKKLGIEIDYN
jgi:hypothetical protein